MRRENRKQSEALNNDRRSEAIAIAAAPTPMTGGFPEQRVIRSQWWVLSQVLLAMLFLNFLTSFNSVWPTPWVVPDARIAPAFVLLWVAILLWTARFGGIGQRTLTVLTVLFLFAVIGRYADESVPAQLGRQLNLYWDFPQLPAFLAVASKSWAWWQLAGLLVVIVLAFWLLTRLIRGSVAVLAEHAAPFALRSPVAMVLTVFWAGMVIANAMKVEATWPYISRPIHPLYERQAEILSNAFLPGRLERVLPASPPLDSDLKVLGGAEVKVLFLESYGATTYDRPDIAEAIAPARQGLESAARAQGQQVLSAFVGAATFGGASDLSHLSFLSGIDLTDPLRHDLLLTTDRETMLDTFERGGYRTIGLYPAMSWAWPEEDFYDFDHYHDAPSLDYRGPKLGLWWLPDQYSMARVDELYPPTPDGAPRFLFYPTITTHVPFRPTPPYQPDWSRITSDSPYPEDAAAAAQAVEIAWTDLIPAYVDTLNYTFTWLKGYLALPQPRESVLILIGDHQPVGSVTGPNASWEVPVHIITSNEQLAARLRAQGFTDGIDPAGGSLGHVSELGLMLLAAFDSGGADPEKLADLSGDARLEYGVD